jgi:FkbM family methyltransferase
MKNLGSGIKLSIKKFFWQLPKRVLIVLMKHRFQQRFPSKVVLGLEKDLIYIEEPSNSEKKIANSIYFYHPIRVGLYFGGIQQRLDKLLSEYCINLLDPFPDGLVIDVGSNVGEFTLALNHKFPGRKFIRFEPSDHENLAAQKNLTGIDELLINQPLWSHVTTLKWWEANKTGDSSIFRSSGAKSSTMRTTTTLDTVFKVFDYPKIALLKLEAEGAEPEILQGAQKTLENTVAIAADLGPERGIDELRTFDDSFEYLTSVGFKLKGRNSGGRECFLFINDKYKL